MTRHLTLTPQSRRRRGATAIEYAVIAGIVSIGIIASLTAFGKAASDLWAFIATTVDAAI